MVKKYQGPPVSKDMDLAEALRILKLDPQKKHIWNALYLLQDLDIGADTRAAELGCSGHETLIILQKMGVKNITIADYDEEFLKNVKKDFNEDIVVYKADFNDPLPMGDKSFDLITTFEVAEHIVLAEEYLKELNRILSDNGYLLLTTPNHAFYKSRLRALKGRRLGMEGMHYRFYTKDQFEEMLKVAGFRIIKRNSLGHLPFGDIKALRKVCGVNNVRHYIPKFLESLSAINFIWLCKKINSN
jgi:2-polyprenyl-3-methyl-5-hydroxy-6-metoxy-1,4-benzoquinol methylase